MKSGHSRFSNGLRLALGALAAALCVGCLHASEALLPTATLLARSFETPQASWKIEPGQPLVSRTLQAPAGTRWDFRDAGELSINAERSGRGTATARMRWIVTSKVGGAYLGPAVPLALTGVSTAAVNLQPSSGQLTPVGHQRPWDALAAAEVVAIELRVEATFGKGLDDQLTLNLRNAAIAQLKPARVDPEIEDVRVWAPPAGSRAAAELSFRITPLPDDPFSSSGAGDVRVKLDDGREALAFLDQELVARDDGSAQRLAEYGPPRFRAFLPGWAPSGNMTIRSGTRTWSVACSALGPLRVRREAAASASNVARPPKEMLQPKTLPRARWQTPQEGSAESGTAAAWIGKTTPWTLDEQGAWRSVRAELGTHSNSQPYDPVRGSEADSARGIWRPVPFWTAAWGAYADGRRVDAAMALQMDAALARAAEQGDSRPLAILDGGTFERQGVFNWASHPLRGKVAGPGELFRTPEGIEFCARWMRYCVARYAHYRSVNALWLTTALNAPGASEFHAKMGPLLHEWNTTALPVLSFHPLARPVRVVWDVTSPGQKEDHPLVRWLSDRRLDLSVLRTLPQGGEGDTPCFELRAQDADAGSITMLNRLRVEFSDFRRPADDNFFDCDALTFDVRVPPDAPPDLRVGVHLRDRDGQWFQALLPGMARPGDWTTYALDLTDANAHGLAGIHHKKAWTAYSRQRITEIGLHLYSTHPSWRVKGSAQHLSARFDNIQGVVLPQHPKAAPLKIVLFDPAGQAAVTGASGAANGEIEKKYLQRSVERGTRVDFHFQVSKAFANPFDPRDCDLTAVILTPSGKTVKVPAFFDQLCERREQTPGGNEIVEPLGAEFFTVRFRAQETGPHAVLIELREGGRYDISRRWEPDNRFTPEGEGQAGYSRGWANTQYPAHYPDGRRPIDKVTWRPGKVTASLDLGANAFTVVQSAKPFHGFVRVAADKRHFECDDGSFFYPMGPCLRSPSDTRIPYDSEKFDLATIDKLGKRGTYQYDDYFDSFQKAGMTWARVWMCSWWGALEWRRDWPGYQGLGRYNLLNGWRMDYIVDSAEQHGIRLNLAITNHGQFTLNIDTEWANNPYNAKLGGPLHAACEIFTRAEGKIAHMNKLRYVAARYGHSPNIMAFALFSELEFTEEYDRSLNFRNGTDVPAIHMEEWHQEMAGFLKTVDPNRHLVSTHFSHPGRGENVLMNPAVDIATSNAYSAFDDLANGSMDAGAALHDFWLGNGQGFQGFKIFNKPALVEEQGRHWMGMDGGRQTNTKSELDADLHAGLWGSMVTPLSGATGYWWWLHVHFDNRYGDYRALANFMEGEDFRPLPGETLLEPAFRTISDNLYGRAMKSNRRIYAWLFNPKTPLGDEEPELVSGGVLKAGNLAPGTYSIEFWNTYSGEVISRQEMKVADEKQIQIKIPDVKRDIAMKMKLKTENTRK